MKYNVDIKNGFYETVDGNGFVDRLPTGTHEAIIKIEWDEHEGGFIGEEIKKLLKMLDDVIKPKKGETYTSKYYHETVVVVDTDDTHIFFKSAGGAIQSLSHDTFKNYYKVGE